MKLQMTLFGTPAPTPPQPAEPVLESAVAVKNKSVQAPSAQQTRQRSTTKQAAPARQNRTRKATSERRPSGLVPEGDVRLTANIRQDLHLRLKIAAALRRTTIGEIIEELVDRHIKT